MPQGLRVWNSSGDLIIDVSDRIMTVLGRIEVNSSTPSGTVTVSDARLALGQRWYFKTSTSGGWVGACSVTVTMSSSSITVTVTNSTLIPGPLYITYGVY